jgi:hypothetical protein
MRILEDGREIKKRCPNCKSVLGISSDDILNAVTTPDGPKSVKKHIDCPICFLTIPIMPAEVPVSWSK